MFIKGVYISLQLDIPLPSRNYAKSFLHYVKLLFMVLKICYFGFTRGALLKSQNRSLVKTVKYSPIKLSADLGPPVDTVFTHYFKNMLRNTMLLFNDK